MKNFVLDTNVLLHDPNSIFKFKDNQVVIPIYVIEEIDMFKKEQSELGRNARMVGRLLDDVRQDGNISNGVPLKNGGSLRVGFTERTLPPKLMNNHNQDNRILALALDVKDTNPSIPTILVTKDINLRIRADVLGLTVEDYDPGQVDISELYPGYTEILLEPSQLSAFYQSGSVTIDTKTYYPNEYALLRDSTNPQSTALGRINVTLGRVEQIRKFKQDGVWGIRPRNKEQHFALDLLLDDSVKLVTLVGKAGTGKAQPVSSPILTPTGYRPMGEIEPGQEVMTPDGVPAKVLAVFPQGEKDIYRVRFTDGSSTECCQEHLWYTQTTLDRDYHKPGCVKTLEEIMTSLRYGSQQKRNHSIPITNPIQFAPRSVPIDPYLMGCLIGDGSMSVGQVALTTADQDLLRECEPLLAAVGCHLGEARDYSYCICCDQPPGSPPMSYVRRDPQTNEEKTYASIREVEADGFLRASVSRVCLGQSQQHKSYEWRSIESDKPSVNPVKNALIKFGLWGHRAEGKFIPEDYLLGSVEQRVALLQGLMDTDGTIEKCRHKSFSTVSAKLAENFKTLVQSLGGTVTIKERYPKYTYKGEKRGGQKSYNCNICLPNEIIPFRLPRKLERWAPNEKYYPRRYIDAVEYVGKKQAKCILIDSPERLYITDDFIVTHNTMISIAAGLHKTLEEKSFQRMLVARPVFPMGKDIGYLPGTLEEKLNPWMQPIFDNVEFLLGLQKGNQQGREGRGYHELIDLGVLQIEPLTYIRGRSIPHQWMIVDEAQNLTPHEVKTIVTRAGEGTKIIFTGDPYQIDHPYIDAANNGLTYLVNKFKEHKLGGHLTLIKGERSELAELAANIL
jgi:predicted ribonuclease YlaK